MEVTKTNFLFRVVISLKKEKSFARIKISIKREKKKRKEKQKTLWSDGYPLSRTPYRHRVQIRTINDKFLSLFPFRKKVECREVLGRDGENRSMKNITFSIHFPDNVVDSQR